jgi:hypothetical protein
MERGLAGHSLLRFSLVLHSRTALDVHKGYGSQIQGSLNVRRIFLHIRIKKSQIINERRKCGIKT